MKTIKVYRNISSVDKFFGLELADGCLMLGTFFVAFMVNRNGLFVNFGLLFLIYLGLRAVKRGKPDGYILGLTRYALMSRFKRQPGYEESERA